MRQVGSTGEREDRRTRYVRIISYTEDVDQKLRRSVEPVRRSVSNCGVIFAKTRASVLAHLGMTLH